MVLGSLFFNLCVLCVLCGSSRKRFTTESAEGTEDLVQCSWSVVLSSLCALCPLWFIKEKIYHREHRGHGGLGPVFSVRCPLISVFSVSSVVHQGKALPQRARRARRIWSRMLGPLSFNLCVLCVLCGSCKKRLTTESTEGTEDLVPSSRFVVLSSLCALCPLWFIKEKIYHGEHRGHRGFGPVFLVRCPFISVFSVSSVVHKRKALPQRAQRAQRVCSRPLGSLSFNLCVLCVLCGAYLCSLCSLCPLWFISVFSVASVVHISVLCGEPYLSSLRRCSRALARTCAFAAVL